MAPAASRTTERKAPTASGIPSGLESKKSLATNKLSNVIARALGKPFAAERVVLPDAVSGALDALGRIIGRPVVVFRVTQGRLNANGLVLPEDGDTESRTIFVNEASASPVVTVAAHEVLHKLRKDRPDLYSFVVAEVQKRAKFVEWKAEIDSRELTSGKRALRGVQLPGIGKAQARDGRALHRLRNFPEAAAEIMIQASRSAVAVNSSGRRRND